MHVKEEWASLHITLLCPEGGQLTPLHRLMSKSSTPTHSRPWILKYTCCHLFTGAINEPPFTLSRREGVSLRWRVRLGIQPNLLRVLRNSQGSPPLEKGKSQGRNSASPSNDHKNQDELRAESSAVDARLAAAVVIRHAAES